jgi:hypothetical protein
MKLALLAIVGWINGYLLLDIIALKDITNFSTLSLSLGFLIVTLAMQYQPTVFKDIHTPETSGSKPRDLYNRIREILSLYKQYDKKSKRIVLKGCLITHMEKCVNPKCNLTQEVLKLLMEEDQGNQETKQQILLTIKKFINIKFELSLKFNKNNILLRLSYASFLNSFMNSKEKALLQIEIAKRQNCNFVQRFSLYRIE